MGLKVRKVLGKHKMGKHFDLSIEEGKLSWTRKTERIRVEEELDGIYIVRTSEEAGSLSREEAVRQYKNLSRVERIYRTVKGVDILIRPIRHRTEERVRAHIFLCLLAYYVEWHMKKALASLLFIDEEAERLHALRDPVSKALPSESAKQKKAERVRQDGLPLHSFPTLLEALGGWTRQICRLKGHGEQTRFTQYTEMDALQKTAFELLGLRPVGGS